MKLIANLSHVVQVLDDLEIDHAGGVFREVPKAHYTFIREARRALLTPSLRDPEGVLSLEEEARAEALAEAQAYRQGTLEGQEELPF